MQRTSDKRDDRQENSRSKIDGETLFGIIKRVDDQPENIVLIKDDRTGEILATIETEGGEQNLIFKKTTLGDIDDSLG